MTDPAQTGRAAQSPAAADADGNAAADEDAVRDASHMSPRLVYQVIHRKGDEELDRSNIALFQSAIAAGLSIGVSVLGEAVCSSHLARHRPAAARRNLRLHLRPCDRDPWPDAVVHGHHVDHRAAAACTAQPAGRGHHGAAMGHGAIGCLLAALFIAHPPAFSPDMLDSVAAISREATGSGFVGRFAKAVPAGLLIAALVWMHPSGTRGVFLSSSP